LVQRFRKCGTALHGGPGIHRVRNPLVRDGASPVRGVERGAGWVDGDRLSLRFRPWSVCVSKGWRRSSDDHLHRSGLDLSRGSSNAAGGVEQRLALVALLQCLTGIWLMYCTWAVGSHMPGILSSFQGVSMAATIGRAKACRPQRAA